MGRPTRATVTATVALLVAAGPATRPATVATDRGNELAAHARELLRRGDPAGADAAAAAALAADRRNASASYLRGVIAFAAGETPAARRAFEAAAAVVPDDPATLNNLAVVLWRQNQPAPALLRWDRAMAAAPGNRAILDNVAVAERELSPAAAAQSPLIGRTLKRFHEQDAALAKAMAASGLRRINGVWMSDADVAKLDDRQRRAVAALDAIAAGEAADAARVAEVDAALVAINRELAGVSAAATRAARPTPARRQELVAEANGLRSERGMLADRMAAGDAQANQWRPLLPAPPRPTLFGPEATPFVPAGG